jgi:hypothetical protein
MTLDLDVSEQPMLCEAAYLIGTLRRTVALATVRVDQLDYELCAAKAALDTAQTDLAEAIRRCCCGAAEVKLAP